jgi:predicted ester cyclase
MKNTKNALTALVLTLLSAAPAGAAKKPSPLEFMERYFAAVDTKQPERLAEVESPDVVMVTPGGTFKGLEGPTQMITMFGTAFPNFKHSVSHCIQQGDELFCEGHFTGDHTGPLRSPTGQTVPATGRHVEFPWLGLATVKNGKVTVVHVYFDSMVMMQQLGLVPAPTVAKK